MTKADGSNLRLAFAGTPPFAATVLKALAARHHVAFVYTQPPRPTGRGRKLEASAVAQLAARLDIEVRAPVSLRGEADRLRSDAVDAMIVVAYGLILPKAILATPRLGCINVHASLLPRWRGAAPIERAIMAGDTETGVTIMQMDPGLDTGPILCATRIPIRDDDTGDSLTERLAVVGATTLLQCLDRLASIVPTPQPAEGATYATKLAAEESLVNWHEPAVAVARKIRALYSRHPAYSIVAGERMRWLFADVAPQHGSADPGTVIALAKTGLLIQCDDGAVRITRLALSRGSGKPMDIAAFANGHASLLRVGQVLDAS